MDYDDDGTEELFETVMACLENVPTKSEIQKTIGDQVATLGAKIDKLQAELDALKGKDFHASCSAEHSAIATDVNKLRQEVDLAMQSLDSRIR